MKGQNLHSPFPQIISDPEAAALLTDPVGQRFLAPFMAQECTVSEAAKQLGVSSNSLLYRVNRMLKLGLIEVVRQEPRPGRAIKVYRSSADAFFVPFALTPAESLEALFIPTGTYWESLFIRNIVQIAREAAPEVGIQIWRGQTEELYAKPASRPGELLDFAGPDLPPMLAFWSVGLWLDETEARELQQDLLKLYKRYARHKGKQRHIIHLAMAPWVLQEESLRGDG